MKPKPWPEILFTVVVQSLCDAAPGAVAGGWTGGRGGAFATLRRETPWPTRIRDLKNNDD